jgi:hypothetical protein
MRPPVVSDIPAPTVGDTLAAFDQAVSDGLAACPECGLLRCLHGGAQEEGT